MDLPIEKLKHSVAFILICSITLILSSGFLFIFVFNKGLFLTIDNIKLSILSVAVALPFFMLNSVLLIIAKLIGLIFSSKDDVNDFNKFLEKEKEFVFLGYILFSSFIAAFQIYYLAFLGYFKQYTLIDSLYDCLYFFSGLYTVYLLSPIFNLIKKKILPKTNLRH